MCLASRSIVPKRVSLSNAYHYPHTTYDPRVYPRSTLMDAAVAIFRQISFYKTLISHKL